MGKKKGGNAKGKKESAAAGAGSRNSAVKKEFLLAKHINATVMILRMFLSDEEIESLQYLGPKGKRVGSLHDCRY